MRLLKQQPRMKWAMLAAFSTATFLTGSIFLVGSSKGIPLENLTGDPAMVTRSSILIGVLSNLGMLLWAGTSTCAFLGAVLQRGDRRRYLFLFISGLFSAFLAIDDLLTLHEHVFPHYFHVPEIIVYLVYLFLAGGYLIYFLGEILTETYYPILAVSLLFLAVSLTITKLIPGTHLLIFIKDCLKFYGIVFWLVYFFSTVIHFEGV